MENKKNIYQKLAEAKKHIGAITKDSTNPFFKNSYFDINAALEVVEPFLLKERLVLLQPIIEGAVCTQIIDIDSEKVIESRMNLSDQKDPQKLGSEITYFRRYTLVSLLSLQAEDDDGNKAAKPTPQKTKKKPEASEKAIDKMIVKIDAGEKDILKKATDSMTLTKGQIISLMDAQILYDDQTK